MRLMENRKRPVTLRPKIGGTDIPVWGVGTVIRSIIQPVSSKVLAEMYGERITKMKLLLYDGATIITEGMGVCVELPGDQPCDYKVICTEQWAGHQRAIIEWIPANRRA